MPISPTAAHLLLRSLFVYVPIGDARLINMANRYQPATVTAVNGVTASVNRCVGGLAPAVVAPEVFSAERFAVAMRVLNHLNTIAAAGVGAIRSRVQEMEYVVADLRLNWAALTSPYKPATPVVLSLAALWSALTGNESAAVRAYARERNSVHAIETLYNTARSGGAGVPTLANLQGLAAAVSAVDAARPGADNRYAGITSATLPDIRTLYGQHPPGAAFPGFGQWGPGDHGATDLNITGHFLKHVCGVAGVGVVVDDAAEHGRWWRTLEIRLTLPQVELACAHQNLDSVRGYFTGPDQTLPPGDVQNFLGRVPISGSPLLLSHLVDNFEPAYRDYAIAASRAFDEVLVQSNGERTFVAGSRGELFVIGRLDGGVLGISACYLPTNIELKMVGSRSNKLWDLV